jgi:hypothetical protein
VKFCPLSMKAAHRAVCKSAKTIEALQLGHLDRTLVTHFQKKNFWRGCLHILATKLVPHYGNQLTARILLQSSVAVAKH